MSLNTLSKEKGFTIVEVVLVLAIAGLIFLIVFLALPQLQRSRRDTQRRSDVSRVLAQLEQFASNNNSQYPQASCAATASPDSFSEFIGGVGNYFAAGELDDPSTGAAYTCNVAATDPTAVGVINYRINAVCQGTASGNRNVAVRIFLETGGVYCGDNQ